MFIVLRINSGIKVAHPQLCSMLQEIAYMQTTSPILVPIHLNMNTTTTTIFFELIHKYCIP